MSLFSDIPKASAPAWINDLLPRLLLIALAIFLAQTYNQMSGDEQEQTWLDALEQNTVTNAQALNRYLTQKTSYARNLAEDYRITGILGDPQFNVSNLPVDTRRALYEFQQAHDVDNAYVFDSSISAVIATSRGAIDLPETLLRPFYSATQDNIAHVTDIIAFDEMEFFLFSHAIFDTSGQVKGYIIYIENTSKIITETSTIATKLQHSDYVFLRLNTKEATAQIIDNYMALSPRIRTVEEASYALPIFDEVNFVGLEEDETQQAVLASIRYLQDFPAWAIAATIPQTHLLKKEQDQATVLTFACFVFGLIMFLLPLKGPYSAHLRAIYYILGIGKNASGLTLSDIENMRNGSSSSDDGAPIDWDAVDWEEMGQKSRTGGQNKKEKKRTPSQAEIAYAIRRGMRQRNLELLYQPIINVDTKEILSHEVFLQIIDETREVLSPALWHPVAVKENLFQLIDETVFKVAADKFFLGANAQNVPLSFNIAGDTFESFNFLEEMLSNADNGEHIATNTIFEIRSREMVADKRALEFIRQCRAKGFRFAVDYLGGGEKTILATKKMKFDFIKFDVSTFDMTDKESLKELIRLVRTATSNNLPVIVEKVEDEKTVSMLQRLGVKYMQGYYFTKPKHTLTQSDSL